MTLKMKYFKEVNMKKKIFRERYSKVIDNLETFEEMIPEPKVAYIEVEEPEVKKVRKTTKKKGKK